jgi:hypothetical protein
MKIPDVYKCPITGEVMADPLIASCGHTFERGAIEGWFEAHPNEALRCPVDNVYIGTRKLHTATALLEDIRHRGYLTEEERRQERNFSLLVRLRYDCIVEERAIRAHREHTTREMRVDHTAPLLPIDTCQMYNPPPPIHPPPPSPLPLSTCPLVILSTNPL